MAVKKAVQSGNVEDAIEKVNDLNPEVSLQFLFIREGISFFQMLQGIHSHITFSPNFIITAKCHFLSILFFLTFNEQCT